MRDFHFHFDYDFIFKKGLLFKYYVTPILIRSTFFALILLSLFFALLIFIYWVYKICLIFAGELGGSFFGYVADFKLNNLPELPSESARSQRSGGSSSINDCISDDVCSTRSGSPRPGSE